MNQFEIQREIAAFQEKHALAVLEVSKAQQRADEIAYQQKRFELDLAVVIARDSNVPPAGDPAPDGLPDS